MDETNDLGLLSQAAVLVDVGRELVVASGSDRVRFLQGIVTGDIAGTPEGGGCHAALLTTKAHVVAEMWAFPRLSDLYLAVPRGEGANTAAALSRYAIMDDFAAAPHPDFALMGLLGPLAGARLASGGYSSAELESRPLWSHVEASGPAGLLWLVRARQLAAEGFWIGGAVASVDKLADTLATLGVRRLASGAAEAARVDAGEPAWGREITGDTFPMEVGLDDAIDYKKGCFLGQEPIVRIRDRGHINWRLVRLDLQSSASDLPVPGDRLETDTKPKAGRVTSIARLPNGRAVALALAHVTVATGQQVTIRATEGDRTSLATVR